LSDEIDPVRWKKNTDLSGRSGRGHWLLAAQSAEDHALFYK